ncbi:MAG: Rid family hydrolase [Patescibacteria group bacterium]|jgi:enamine deaminase RidA (YjgF/YER057c/UK114 family)
MIKRIPDGLMGWPVMGPYSPALEVSPGHFVFSGIITDLDAKKQPIVTDRNEQIILVLLKCLKALDACGLGVRDLIRFHARFAGSMEGYAYLGQLMKKHCGSDLPFPARDAYAVAELPGGKYVHIEIIMEAIRQEE